MRAGPKKDANDHRIAETNVSLPPTPADAHHQTVQLRPEFAFHGWSPSLGLVATSTNQYGCELSVISRLKPLNAICCAAAGRQARRRPRWAPSRRRADARQEQRHSPGEATSSVARYTVPCCTG